MTKSLEGVRVVEYSPQYSGAYCTMVLAALGAEVIRIEPPESTACTAAPYEQASLRRGKRRIRLNLQNEKAREFLFRLLDTADIFVVDADVETIQSLDLTYEALSKRSKRLIYCACSSFGMTGSFSGKSLPDLIIQGLTGAMFITGCDAEHPCRCGLDMTEISTGIHAVLGCLAALFERRKTGTGQCVDIAMFDVMMALLENPCILSLNTDFTPTAVGNRDISVFPYATLRAKDGCINISAGNDSLFSRLAQALGIPEIATDSRFATNHLRMQNWPDLEKHLNAAMETKTIREWQPILEAAGIPVGPILEMDQTLQLCQIRERNLITTVHQPGTGDIRCITPAVRLSDSPIDTEVFNQEPSDFEEIQ
ncbi:MAG: CoA transferase [Proteobacteria bacterium]|nr:CoA transferase [Pseudomonadota bacterium]